MREQAARQAEADRKAAEKRAADKKAQERRLAEQKAAESVPPTRRRPKRRQPSASGTAKGCEERAAQQKAAREAEAENSVPWPSRRRGKRNSASWPNRRRVKKRRRLQKPAVTYDFPEGCFVVQAALSSRTRALQKRCKLSAAGISNFTQVKIGGKEVTRATVRCHHPQGNRCKGAARSRPAGVSTYSY